MSMTGLVINTLETTRSTNQSYKNWDFILAVGECVPTPWKAVASSELISRRLSAKRDAIPVRTSHLRPHFYQAPRGPLTPTFLPSGAFLHELGICSVGIPLTSTRQGPHWVLNYAHTHLMQAPVLPCSSAKQSNLHQHKWQQDLALWNRICKAKSSMGIS